MAVESAARDAFFNRGLRKGRSLVELEQVWSDSHTTTQRVSLAVHDESRSDFKDKWAAAPYRRNGLNNVGVALHHGLKENIDPTDAVHDVRRLVKDIQEGAK